MQFNFFTWVREGVRQSVLLGVSDAIEQLGTPENSEDISPRLLEFMRAGETDDKTRAQNIGGPKRTRLGRSLKDIEAEAAPTG